MRDVEIFRDAEALCAKFGVSLPFAVREWADARTMLGGASLLGNAKTLADALHGIEEIGVRDAKPKIHRIEDARRPFVAALPHPIAQACQIRDRVSEWSS